MYKEIGPYTLSQRTKYSKIQVFDNTGKNITYNPDEFITVKKIIDDYNMCMDGSIFDIQGSILNACLKKTNIKYLFIPEGITYIAQEAFIFSDANYIHFPSTLKKIGKYAFSSCGQLKEVVIPNNVEEIFDGVFNGCVSMERAILPERLKSLSDYIFSSCESLKELYIPETVTHIGSGSISYCRDLEKINIPRDFNSVGFRPFAGSQIETLVFNFDTIDKKKVIDVPGGFLMDSDIRKIEINNNVSKINEEFFKYSGKYIKEIDYIGTEAEFKKFKSENKHFLRSLRHAKLNIKEDLEISSNETKSEFLIENIER